MVKTARPLQEARIRSLIGKLRSHMPQGVASKEGGQPSTHGGDGGVKMEAEIGVMLPEALEHCGKPAATSSWTARNGFFLTFSRGVGPC